MTKDLFQTDTTLEVCIESDFDGQIKDALEDRDALRYARLCVEHGIAYDLLANPLLYDKGLGEMVILKEKEEKMQHAAYVDNIEKFLIAAVGTIDVNRFDSHYTEKRKLLIKHFPESFAEDGKQPVQDYSPAKVGALFKGVYTGYVKKLEKLKE